jgi:hypothetical protein
MKLGEIARNNGFKDLNDMIEQGLSYNKEVENTAFKVNDIVKLKENYKPTHFNEEKVLTPNTKYKVTHRSNISFGDYFIKLEGQDVWFNSSVFILDNNER